MHRPESAGDSASIRKMAHPVTFPRRGSSTSTGSASALTAVIPTNVSNNAVSTDEYQSSLLVQPPPPGGLSSPGPQHPPQSLNLSQPQVQPLSLIGVQIKKKSGFQITSVTPAQVSLSTNNSVAEDTESYDDLDESHTEDLSSSEILDVSLSRATDMGGAERSSSEETLNNFHEVDTPGAVSPNQPPHRHPLPQALQHGTMVNGTVHHHQVHATQSKVALSGTPEGGAVSTVSSSTGILPGVTQNVGAVTENMLVGSTSAVGSSGAETGMPSAAAGIANGMTNPLTNNVSNVNIPVGVLNVGGSSVSHNIGLAPANLNSCNGITGGHIQNVSLVHQQCGTVCSGTGIPVSMGSASAGQGGTAGVTQGSSIPPSQAPAPAATGSRFRVVKLDCSSEQFKKGRWTCTQYYDKETSAAAAACSSDGGQRAAESATCSERDCTSGSSVGSTVSTLSHYTESVSSGEMGGPPATQIAPQLQEYSTVPAPQASLAGLSLSTSQLKASANVHDVNPLLKPNVAPSAGLAGLAGSQQQASIHPAVVQQPLTYTQVPQAGPAQGLPASAPQHQLGFTQAPTQLVPAHAVPQVISPGGQAVTTGPNHMPHMSGTAHAMVSSGTGLGIAGQQSTGSVHSAGSQALPSAFLQQPSSSQAGTLPHMLPGGLLGLAQPLAKAQQLPGQQVMERQQGTGAQNLGTQTPSAGSSGVPAPSIPPSFLADAQSGPPVQSCSGLGVIPGQGAQLVGAQYPSWSSITATQLEDAQRLLFQHKTLLSLPKVAAGECASEIPTSSGPDGSGDCSALTASAGLLTNPPVEVEDESSSGASVVAIDNKIEQAMDLVKSHLMYAVREEVEVLKEQIKELIERNSQLEQENSLLKNLASPEQLAQFQAQVQSGSPPPSTQPQGAAAQQSAPPAQSASQSSGPSA
ncbi:TSC22 domain family protein 1-like isoform X1 [Paramormyrops kingsleyae]|uniref:TSC22 domain family protein 1 n=2 Tax=Paramormyrops kingsleyae TaxID=1676925 RepID=A0A3B3SSH8_9TELE|nr:TSC22 domain family protein 1-like isoform X1 [Paramormyrops kingsleyae]